MPPYDPKIITLNYHSRNDPEDLKALAFEINLALREELRPAKLKKLLDRDPMAPRYDDTRERLMAERLVEKIVQSRWHITRLPSSPWHSAPPCYGETDEDEG